MPAALVELGRPDASGRDQGVDEVGELDTVGRGERLTMPTCVRHDRVELRLEPCEHAPHERRVQKRRVGRRDEGDIGHVP